MSILNRLDRLIHGPGWTQADKRAFIAAHKSVHIGYRTIDGHTVAIYGPPGSKPYGGAAPDQAVG
jgi:hypothetical protein